MKIVLDVHRIMDQLGVRGGGDPQSWIHPPETPREVWIRHTANGGERGWQEPSRCERRATSSIVPFERKQ